MLPQRPLHRWLQNLQVLIALRVPTLYAAWLVRYISSPKPNTVRNILIVRMDGIGDAVLTLPLIERLRLCLPHAQITVLTREELADVFRMAPSVDEVLALPLKQHHARLQLVAAASAALRFAWLQLGGRTFDAALSPRWDVDITMATLFTCLSGAPIRIGYEDATSPDRLRLNRGFQCAFTHILPAGPQRHEALRSAALAEVLGCSGEAPRPRLVSPVEIPPAVAELRRIHPETPLLAIGLPCGAAARRWPSTKYIAAIQAILRQHAVSVVLISDATTVATAEAIEAVVPGSVHLNTLDLPAIAAALTQCKVYVGSDTGIGHMAAVIGCAMVTLTPHPQAADPAHRLSPNRFGPLTELVTVLRPMRGRPGCEQGCLEPEPHCILDISPQEAADAVLLYLDQPAR